MINLLIVKVLTLLLSACCSADISISVKDCGEAEAQVLAWL